MDSNRPESVEGSEVYKTLFATDTMSSLYKKYRPQYPDGIFSTMDTFIKEKLTSPFDLALDVGCGPGHSTFALTKFFSQVIGVDVSETQIKQAQNDREKPTNVDFRVGSAFSLPAEDGQATLVCSGLAAHWFDPIEEFYAEADRVLRPGGALVLFGYAHPTIVHDEYGEETNDILVRKLRDHLAVFNYDGMDKVRSEKVNDCNNLYKDFVLPYDERKRVDSFEINIAWTLDEVLGYISTWSFYPKFLSRNPGAKEPLELAKQEILALFKRESGDDIILNAKFKVFMLLGRKPLI